MILPLLCFAGLQALPSSGRAQEPAAAVAKSPIATLKRDALSLEPLVTSRLAKDFLKATANLTAISPRTVYLDESTKTYKSEAAAAALSQQERSRLKRIDLDASFYWNTKYGSPLAYARPLDVLGRSGLNDVSGLKILDFGYGTIGHLRLLAWQGADLTGIDVDPLLHALYSAPTDQGLVKNLNRRDGQIRLIDGRFPADPATTAAVGENYDVFISKNTLKKGYVHPERPVEPRRLLNLNVDDDVFLKTLHHAVKPGGWVLIYNICPAPSPPGQPYKNWADGRCPFSRDLWEKAGFHVIAFDQDDTPAVRAIAHALGWDRGSSPIDLKSDLFAMYSLMQRIRFAT
jgi:SAM-dependent methyltransferase